MPIICINMKAKHVASLIGTVFDILSVIGFFVGFLLLIYAVLIMPF